MANIIAQLRNCAVSLNIERTYVRIRIRIILCIYAYVTRRRASRRRASMTSLPKIAYLYLYNIISHALCDMRRGITLARASTRRVRACQLGIPRWQITHQFTCSLVPRPLHHSAKKNGLVHEVQFIPQIVEQGSKIG